MTANFIDLSDPTAILLVCAVAMGLSVALIVALFARALAGVPDENREYKDPPPLGFRLFWWPIQWISFYLSAALSAKAQNKLRIKLRKAGLDYSISPAQFIALRIVCAMIFAGIAWWGLGSFEIEAAGKHFSASLYWSMALIGALIGWLYPAIWLRDRLMTIRGQLAKTLPFYLDVITLCVEAGLNLQGAMNQAVLKGPKGVLRDEFMRVLRDIRAGKPRAESMRKMAERVNEPGITNFVSAVIHAENMGMSLGPVLRAQADQRRSERFLRAEKLAMEAPIKMLFPLIAFIFPCTFIVLFFPLVMKFLKAGL